MSSLRGMTWNHVRGYGPLLSTTEQFGRLHPGVRIEWDRRSLKDFGDFPVERLANEYDLILIDHPHVRISSEQGVLLPLDQWISDNFMMDQQINSVGLSFSSYRWNEHQWALPVDAAAQVAAYRPDLLNGRSIPQTWKQVFELIASLPPHVRVGIPLCPTDTMCSFISLCANLGGNEFFNEGVGIDRRIGEEAMVLLLKLLPLLHPLSSESNPMQMLDHMARYDDIAYIPLSFGYSNYAREGFAEKRILFTDIPSHDSVPRGSILGGVGIAVSAFSKHVQTAVDYVLYTASGKIQRSLYFAGGGQPGHRSAWIDEEVNRNSNDFFKNTLASLDLAYLRPREKHFPDFQEKAGEVLHYLLKQGETAKEIVKQLNQLYENCKKLNQ